MGWHVCRRVLCGAFPILQAWKLELEQKQPSVMVLKLHDSNHGYMTVTSLWPPAYLSAACLRQGSRTSCLLLLSRVSQVGHALQRARVHPAMLGMTISLVVMEVPTICTTEQHAEQQTSRGRRHLNVC